MATKQERLVEFVAQHIAPNVDPWAHPGCDYSAKSVDEVAQGLLQTFEFRALRLGTWLGTAEGVDIAFAVEQVLPASYLVELALIVDGLELAAKLQTEEESQYVARVISILGGAGLVVLLAHILGRHARPLTI